MFPRYLGYKRCLAYCGPEYCDCMDSDEISGLKLGELKLIMSGNTGKSTMEECSCDQCKCQD